ncbi:MAG: FkbM family methyltransferase [Desulfovibrionaceae bacterium]
MELNPEQAKKIEVFNYGLSGEEKEITIKYSQTMLGANSTSFDESMYGDGRVYTETDTVQLKRASTIIGDIVEKHSEKIFLKIDCEGDEYAILRDLEKSTVLSKIDIVILEWHFNGARELLDILKRNNFVCFEKYDISMKNQPVGLIQAVNINVKKNLV